MSEHSRREFLGVTLPASMALGAGLTALKPSPAFAAAPQGATNRGYSGALFAIELDGQHVGWLDSVEGGDATADIVLEKVGLDNIQRKHLAGVKYEDIVVTCGTGMSNTFYEWIKASFNRRPLAKSGAIVASDFAGRPVSRLEWSNGILTEISFPALDAASKDAAKMTLKITPATTRMAAPSAAAPTPTGRAVQKKWLPSNFRLQIAGCQTACSRVATIDAIVLKYLQAPVPVGGERSVVAPRQLDFSNLSVTTAETYSGEFFSWHEDFLIKGDTKAEKTGTLEYLTPDLQPLFTLSFAGLGIFKFAPEKMEAGLEKIRRVKAEMYCDSIGFAYHIA